jgi:hypothetical protein
MAWLKSAVVAANLEVLRDSVECQRAKGSTLANFGVGALGFSFCVLILTSSSSLSLSSRSLFFLSCLVSVAWVGLELAYVLIVSVA